jgi:hypothetical protein
MDTVPPPPATASSEHSVNPSLEKETAAPENEHLENIRTVSRVPGNDHYYEKDGLRTYGDDEDHDHEPPVCPVPFKFSSIVFLHNFR